MRGTYKYRRNSFSMVWTVGIAGSPFFVLFCIITDKATAENLAVLATGITVSLEL